MDGAYRSFKISALRLELAFGGLPRENLKLIQHCAVIMEIDVGLDRCDLSDKWACVCSSLPHIMDELLDKVPKFKHLTFALCIQNTDDEEDAQAIASHLLASFRRAVMLDRFSVCFSNAWSQNHNASVEYNDDCYQEHSQDEAQLARTMAG